MGFGHVWAVMAMVAVSFPARAEVGNVGLPTLCNVTGVVKTVLQEEMENQAGRVMVPVVVVEVSAAVPVDSNYKGDFCKRVTSPEGGKGTGYYRLCDAEADFMSAQSIRGVVGMSKGGGRLCLAQIKVVP